MQEQENSTLQAAQAAKVVEVLLKYQSEKNKENAASVPAERMLDIPPPVLPMDAASTSEDSAMPQVVPQMAPESDEPVGVHLDDTVSTMDTESMFDPPMLNAGMSFLFRPIDLLTFV